MSKEEQIEKAVQIIVNEEKKKFNDECTDCEWHNNGKCDMHCAKHSEMSYDCEVLINNGYGNLKEFEKEFTIKLDNIINKLDFVCTNLGDDSTLSKLLQRYKAGLAYSKGLCNDLVKEFLGDDNGCR